MMDWNWGFGAGAAIIGMLLMAAFWVAVIVGIVFLVRWIAGQSGSRPQQGETALDILKKRYARGEITKAEFEERKKDLL